MELIFEIEHNYTDKDKLQFTHDPNNEFVEYHSEQFYLLNEASFPDMGDFTDLEWVEEDKRITSEKVSNFGVKSLPQYGPYGFYTPYYGDGTSRVLVPINPKRTRFDPPIVTVVETNGTFKLTIEDPPSADYECYRVVFRKGWFAEEFVTYDKELTVTLYAGEYDLTVMGYIENDIISNRTEVVTVTSNGEADPKPPVVYEP